MATRPRSKKTVEVEVYQPPRFELQVNGILDIALEVTEAFNLILADYCKRFDVQVREDRKDTKIMFSLVMLGEGHTDGLCAMDVMSGNVMLIQNRCPLLEEWGPYRYVLSNFVEVMCHEFTHACQALTGRNGIDYEVKRLGTDGESYYFDAEEMEARLMSAFYANSVALVPVQSIINRYQDAFGDCRVDVFNEPLGPISQ